MILGNDQYKVRDSKRRETITWSTIKSKSLTTFTANVTAIHINHMHNSQSNKAGITTECISVSPEIITPKIYPKIWPPPTPQKKKTIEEIHLNKLQMNLTFRCWVQPLCCLKDTHKNWKKRVDNLKAETVSLTSSLLKFRSIDSEISTNKYSNTIPTNPLGL